MSRKNIRGQGLRAISSHYTERIDKHAYKKENGHDMSAKVFSASERKNLCDVWINFSNFMKEYDNSIQYVKDIDKDHMQAFLDKRAETCDKNTLQNYKHALQKIEILANDTYSQCNLNSAAQCSVSNDCKENNSKKGVNAVISREDYNKILARAEKSNSQAAYALRLQEHLANRVNGTINARFDKYDAEKGTIKVKGKAGKWHTVNLDDSAKKLIEEIHDKNFNKKDANRLFSIQADSVNKYLQRTEKKLELDENSFHSIRRLKAQEHYDECRNFGMTRQEAMNSTSLFLSHGENRNYMLNQSYIKSW